jgi:hypothetical protein
LEEFAVVGQFVAFVAIQDIALKAPEFLLVVRAYKDNFAVSVGKGLIRLVVRYMLIDVHFHADRNEVMFDGMAKGRLVFSDDRRAAFVYALIRADLSGQ